MMAKRTTPETEEALAALREMLPPGSTCYTILRHVSRSGMQRSISPVVLDEGGPHDISYLVRRVLELRYDERHDGLKVGGCGMDMGFHLVYELSYVLYPDGFTCTGDGTVTNSTGEWCLPRCPSNDHHNPPYPKRHDHTYNVPPMHHNSGGYALNHRWL
jgi:hypothetical protein